MRSTWWVSTSSAVSSQSGTVVVPTVWFAGICHAINLLDTILSTGQSSRMYQQIVYKGRDITALPPADIARLGMVRSFQISAVFPHMTALENVRIALQRRRGDSFDFWRSERVLSAFDARALALLDEVEPA